MPNNASNKNKQTIKAKLEAQRSAGKKPRGKPPKPPKADPKDKDQINLTGE